MAKKSKPTEKVTPYTEEQKDGLFGGSSLFVRAHIDTIEAYCKTMAPGVPMTPLEGTQQHRVLFQSILKILNAPNVQDTVDGLDQIMALFKRESRRALSFKYTQRFINEWIAIETEERDLYSNLCLLFYTFSNPEQLKMFGTSFDIEGYMLKGLNQSARERLLVYLERYLR